MNLFHRWLRRGSLPLVAIFAAISLCCLLISGAVRANAENELYSRRFYTGNSRFFSVLKAGHNTIWKTVINSMRISDYVLYVPVSNENLDIQGVYITGNPNRPPMVGGRFFTASDQFSGLRRAVIWRGLLKNVKQKTAKKQL